MWTYNYTHHNELYHYGVKGMKWGVRHDRKTNPRPSSYKYTKTESQVESLQKQGWSTKKKIAVGVAIVAGSAAIMGAVYLKKSSAINYGMSTITTTPLKECLNMFDNNNSVELPKGTVFQRLSSEATEDWVKRGTAYVSYKFRDNMRYKQRLPSETWLRGGSVYVHKIRTKAPVKAPSSREAAEIYLKLNPNATQAQYMRFAKDSVRRYGESDQSKNQSMTDYINDLISGRNSNNDTAKLFVNELKRLGYNAMVDENDSGGTRKFTQSALILFDSSEYIKDTKTHKLRTAERVMATFFT